MANSANPLSKHFRQPQLYIRLPSDGRWYPNEALEVSETREYPVYPMTARDELTLKTPDALLNGQATVDVIQSCMPNIKNAWEMPSVDLDAILIAIRKATFGHEMEFVTVCPHCKRKNDSAIDLNVLADSITCPDYETTVKVDGLEFYLKPAPYRQINKASQENFDQQRLIAVVSDENMDEAEKLSKFHKIFNKLLDMTVESISNSVAAIKTDTGEVVTDKAFIDEFLRNCNKSVWESVKKHLEDIGKDAALKNIHITCEHEDCGKEYVTPLVFEQSNFFG
jgi:hypothetical protein